MLWVSTDNNQTQEGILKKLSAGGNPGRVERPHWLRPGLLVILRNLGSRGSCTYSFLQGCFSGSVALSLPTADLFSKIEKKHQYVTSHVVGHLRKSDIYNLGDLC